MPTTDARRAEPELPFGRPRRDLVYFFVFDGFADWEAALALCEIRRPGDYRVRTLAHRPRAVRSMAGLAVLPDLVLDEIEPERTAMLLLPGGAAWEHAETGAIETAVRRLHAAGAVIAAISGGALPLARAGLLAARRHVGDHAGLADVHAPCCTGSLRHDADALAVADDRVITAVSVGGVEFAREVIRALGLYDARD
ncbi:MAG TPA: DJ-1/PfpI family protein, partial [Dokdonella sp.]